MIAHAFLTMRTVRNCRPTARYVSVAIMWAIIELTSRLPTVRLRNCSEIIVVVRCSEVVMKPTVQASLRLLTVWLTVGWLCLGLCARTSTAELVSIDVVNSARCHVRCLSLTLVFLFDFFFVNFSEVCFHVYQYAEISIDNLFRFNMLT